MSLPTVIGVDPGLTTGIALRTPDGQWELLQTTPGVVFGVVRHLTERGPAVLAVEQFVVGHRAARSSTPAGGRVARDLISVLSHLARPGVSVVVRNAAQVKPWATDRRLDAAGVPTIPGMRHARDAARHALFAATQNCGLPDPLSRRSPSPEGA